MSDLVIIPLGEPKVLCTNPSPEMLELIKVRYKDYLILLADKVVSSPATPSAVSEEVELNPTCKSEDQPMDTIPLRIVTPPAASTAATETEPKVRRKRRTAAEMAAARAAETMGTQPAPAVETAVQHEEVPLPAMAEPTPPTIPQLATPVEVPEIEQVVAGTTEELFGGN